jgi:hypothetical protein
VSSPSVNLRTASARPPRSRERLEHDAQPQPSAAPSLLDLGHQVSYLAQKKVGVEDKSLRFGALDLAMDRH